MTCNSNELQLQFDLALNLLVIFLPIRSLVRPLCHFCKRVAPHSHTLYSTLPETPKNSIKLVGSPLVNGNVFICCVHNKCESICATPKW